MKPIRFSSLTAISFLALTLCASFHIPSHATRNKRTMKSVKIEQQAARKSIKETTRKLNDNTRRTEQNLRRLDELDGKLQLTGRRITALRSSIDSIDMHIRTASDSAAMLSTRLKALKTEYARALRKMQGSYRDASVISFLFSSQSFKEAKARYRYLKEISSWRKRKLAEISETATRVDSQRNRLDAMNSNRKAALTTLANNENQLREMRDETDRVVSELKKEGSALQATINKNQQRIKSLDRELDRMILAEQQRQEKLRREQEKRKAAQKAARQQKQTAKSKNKKGTATAAPSIKDNIPESIAAADRKLSGSFESNKGRLLFPVRGNYSIVRKFGKQPHPELPSVMTENTGIDIAASPGSKARSIFEGTVSGVFTQDGYSKVVMVRHGNYISIYANLLNINVKAGDKVRANQDLGTINTDPQFGNRTVLHFELRRERTKLNPSLWVK